MPMLPFFGDTIFHHLWNVSWQVCVLAALALLAERMYRDAPPGFRYWLWMLVIVRLVVPLHISITRTMYNPILDSIPVDTAPLTGTIPPAVDAVTHTVTHSGPHMSIAVILGAVWLAGFVFILMYIAVKSIGTYRLLADGTEPVNRADLLDLMTRHAADLGIKRKVGLFACRGDAFSTPAVIGILRPRIILPRATADTWDAREIEPLIVHELVHIRRGDLFANWFQILVHAAFFFHPAVWLANSRIRAAREEICDDLSIARLSEEREWYSRSMIRVGEEFLAHRSFTFAGAGFSEGGNRLGERIGRIMHGNYTPHQRLTALSFVILGAVMTLGAALACEVPPVRVVNTVKPTSPYNTMTQARNIPNIEIKAMYADAADTTGAKKKETPPPTRKKENYLRITVLDDSTFEVGGTRVTKAGLPRAMRDQLPGHGYEFYLDGAVDSLTFMFIMHTSHGVGGYSTFHCAPSISDMLRKAGMLQKPGLMILVDSDSTFIVNGTMIGRSDLDRALGEQMTKFGNDIVISHQRDIPAEVISFVTESAKKAGALDVRTLTQSGTRGKLALPVRIIDNTLFNFGGQYRFVARNDLETALRNELVRTDMRISFIVEPDTPEKTIRMAEEIARRAGANDISCKVVDTKNSYQTGIHVFILDETTVLINDRRVARNDIEKRLRKELQSENQKSAVMILGYPDTPDDLIKYVKEAAKRAGTKEIMFGGNIIRYREALKN